VQVDNEVLRKAYSTIILCLGDKALREVARETTAIGVWDKLESLCMVKTLANRLHIREKIHAYKISDEKPILSQVDEFIKILDDLKSIDVKIF